MAERTERDLSSFERRYLTIGFCDLVGSTALSEEMDPEEVNEFLETFRGICARAIVEHGGELVSPAGDGVMFEFGYPKTRENDAERALLAALSIQQRLQDLRARGGAPIQARLGVCSGLVVVGPETGRGWQIANSITGEAANLAHRLQSLAGPNEIVVSEETLQAVRGQFEAKPLGALSIAGMSRPVRAAQLLRRAYRHAPRREPEPATPFVGRATSLALLEDQWQAACRTGTLRVVEVRGEAGIGKSRLVEEFRHACLGGANVTGLSCLDTQSGIPLHPFANLLLALSAVRADEPEPAKVERISACLTALTGAHSDPEIISGLLGFSVAAGPALAMTPRERKRTEFGLLVDLFRTLCDNRPSYILIEDGHWLDPSSHEFLLDLFDAIADRPVLIVITTRQPLFAPAAHAANPILLQPLSERDSLRIARSLLDQQQDGGEDTLLSHLVGISDGVPFFIEQLVISHLRSRSRRRQRQNPTARRGGPPGLTLPLAELLFERLDRHPRAKALLRILAAIGDPVGIETIGAFIEVSPRSLAGLLQMLVDERLLSVRTSGPSPEYEFRHALLRLACYESMTASAREQLHRRIAHMLRGQLAAGRQVSSAALARHLHAGAQWQEAAAFWLQAGVEAARRSANTEALEHLGMAITALERVPDDAVKGPLLLQVVAAKVGPLAATQGFSAPEILQCCETGLELCERMPSPLIFPFLNARFTSEISSGDIRHSLDSADRFGALAVQSGYEPGEVIAGRLRALALFALGRPTEAEAALRTSIGAYQPQRDESIAFLFGANSKVTGGSLLALIMFYRGQVHAGAKLAARTLREADEIRHPLSTGIAFSYAALICIYSDLPKLAGLLGDRQMAFSEEHGLRVFTAYGRFFRGFAAAKGGSSDEGIATMAAVLRDLEAFNWRLTVPSMLALFAEALNDAGRPAEALAACNRAHEMTAAGGERWGLPEVLRTQAVAAWRLRRADLDPADLLARATEAARQNGCPVFEARALATAADILGPAGSTQRLQAPAESLPNSLIVQSYFLASE